MKYKTGWVILLLLFLSGSNPLFGQQNILFNNDIVVEAGEKQENVFTLGGNILILGRVEESAVAIGGTIIVEGVVNEMILGVGTDITLKPTARINGDVVSLGGTLTKMPGSVIDGDTIFFKSSESIQTLLSQGFLGQAGISLVPILIIFRLMMAFIWFILAVLLIALFPRQITYAALQIRTAFWPVVGTGFIAIIIFAGLVIFSALLSLVLIGIPILLSLIIIGIIIKIFGQVILFYFVGERLYKSFSQKQVPALLAVTIGFILITIVGLIPIIGALVSFVLSIIGWGVVIRTKFGNMENWFRKTA